MNRIQLNLKQLKKLYQSDLSLEKIADIMDIHSTTLRNHLKTLGWTRIPKTRKIKLSKKKIQELQKMGLTNEKILQKLKICRKTLIKFEKENGIYIKNRTRIKAYQKGLQTRQERLKFGLKPEPYHLSSRLDPYKEDIESLLLKGTLRSEIAKKYHVCQATLRNFILLNGWKTQKIKKLDFKRDEIIKLFHQGKSIQYIAAQIGCSHKWLDMEIKKMGLKRTVKEVKFKSRLNDREDLIQELFNAGLSGKEIAKRLNVHPISIYRKIKKLNLVRKKI